jgi:hypothetical protein
VALVVLEVPEVLVAPKVQPEHRELEAHQVLEVLLQFLPPTREDLLQTTRELFDFHIQQMP